MSWNSEDFAGEEATNNQYQNYPAEATGTLINQSQANWQPRHHQDSSSVAPQLDPPQASSSRMDDLDRSRDEDSSLPPGETYHLPPSVSKEATPEPDPFDTSNVLIPPIVEVNSSLRTGIMVSEENPSSQAGQADLPIGTVTRPSIVLPNTSVPCSLEQALEALSPAGGPLDPEVSEDEDEPSTLTLVSQVWSLTQFYSVDFSPLRNGVEKGVFNKRTVKVCLSFS